MPYTNQVQPVNFFASYLQGRQAAQEDQAQQIKNSLAQQNLSQVTRQNALYSDPNATPEQFVRAGDTQTGTALQGMQDDKQKAVAQLGAVAQQALTIQDPVNRRAFLHNAQRVYAPAFQALGGDPSQALDNVPDDQLTQRLQQVAQFAPPKQPIAVNENQSLVLPDPNSPGGYRPVFQGAPKPEDPLAKLNEDHAKGLVSDKDYGARMKMLTTPEAATKPQLVSVPQPDGTLQYQWVIPGQTGGPNVGAPKQPGGGGARMQVMFSRVVGAGNEVAQALHNISRLSIGSDSGLAGIGTAKPVGFLQTSKAALGNAVSSQDVQRYNVIVSGVKRNLASIEAAGLQPGETLTSSMASVELKPGDTELTKLTKMAEVRQIAEKGLEIYLDNPQIPDVQKAKVTKIIEQLQKAVPYSQDDITDLMQARNPQTTIADVAKANKLAPGTGPSAGPVRVQSDADYAKLPSGAQYIAPDGSTRTKR